MTSIKGSTTEKNLMKSFAGESQAACRYQIFAKQAKKEGFEQIAALFAATAEQELYHARHFFGLMEGGALTIEAVFPGGPSGSTIDNLIASANGENEEWTELYPQFEQTAREEGFPAIAAAFKLIAAVEAEHESRFLKLLRNVEEGRVFERDEDQKWECRKCGYVHTGSKAPEQCPLCRHPKAYFELRAGNY